MALEPGVTHVDMVFPLAGKRSEYKRAYAFQFVLIGTTTAPLTMSRVCKVPNKRIQATAKSAAPDAERYKC